MNQLKVNDEGKMAKGGSIEGNCVGQEAEPVIKRAPAQIPGSGVFGALSKARNPQGLCPCSLKKRERDIACLDKSTFQIRETVLFSTVQGPGEALSITIWVSFDL